MAINKTIRQKITTLKKEFDILRQGKESLLEIIDETEIPESVYNSNAIENSTLTLKETEKILLDMEIMRNVSLREVYEVKNLAKVIEYIRNNFKKREIDKEMILFLHKVLLSGIDDDIAGRFRKYGEYVRVGAHIAPAPEHIERMIDSIISDHTSNFSAFFLEKIAKFHLEFETIHPFNDGNGRIGRVLIYFQLQCFGFPMIIIRDKNKKDYYKAFDDYRIKQDTKRMERVVCLALLESLHKRIAYLKGLNIMKLSDYIKKYNKSASSITNAAKRQSIPAFREKGIWKIGED